MSYPLPSIWREYAAAAWAADLNLDAEVPGHRAVVIRVKTAGSGTLVYRSRALPNTDQTLTGLADDDEFPMSINAIDSTTSLTDVWVGFADSSRPEV